MRRMLARALVRRCPRCGDRRAWYIGFFRMSERCVGCGLKRTRGVDGHELGSMTVAIVVNIGVIMSAMAVAIALALLWAVRGPLGRLIDRSIDRNLPDPRWFEA